MAKFSEHIPSVIPETMIVDTIVTTESWAYTSIPMGKPFKRERSGIRMYLLSTNLGVRMNLQNEDSNHLSLWRATGFLIHLNLLMVSATLTLSPFLELCTYFSFLTCPLSLFLSQYTSFGLKPHEIFISYSGSFYL